MGDPVSISKNKAAVLVVDNEYGFILSAEAWNKIGASALGKLLAPAYDQVFSIVAHDRNPQDNVVANTLKQAAAKYGTVDMVVAMHTNMGRGQLAQVPIEAYTSVLTDAEKAHAGLMYSMGCRDGNADSALTAQSLGFKQFVGHRGATYMNGVFTYLFLSHLIRNHESTTQAATSSYVELNQCVPQFRDDVVKNAGPISQLFNAAKECSSPKNNSIPLSTCVASHLRIIDMLAISGVYARLVTCMPEAKTFIDENADVLREGMSTIELSQEVTQMTSGDIVSMGNELEIPMRGALRAIEPYVQSGDVSDSLEKKVKDPKVDARQRFTALHSLLEFDYKKYSHLLTLLVSEGKKKHGMVWMEWDDQVHQLMTREASTALIERIEADTLMDQEVRRIMRASY